MIERLSKLLCLGDSRRRADGIWWCRLQ